MSDIDGYSPEFTVPHSREAEEAFLGSLLIASQLSRAIIVNPSDFYIIRNRWIYEAIRELDASGSQIDILTVISRLESHDKLNEIGGSSYVVGLINKCPTSLHAESYAAIIKDKAVRRRILEIANDAAKMACDPSIEVENTVGRIATDLANSARPKGGAQHASIFASRHYDRIDALATGSRVTQRIPTGFADFDKCLSGGLRIPEMLLLMGKPGLGKTKFVMQLGFQMGASFPGAIYEMETDEDQIMDREVSRLTKILDTRLETGKLKDDEWPLYTHAIEQLGSEKTRVFLDFSSGWTTVSLRADLARLKADYGIRWYMIDYLKFLRDKYGKDEIERLNHISGQLKQINRELDLASVVIHSMNKAGIASAAPDLNDQSGGADISFDTDKALFMMPHVPKEGEQARKNYRTFIFRKSRSRLEDTIFHLEAVDEYPEFRNIALPGQTEPYGLKGRKS